MQAVCISLHETTEHQCYSYGFYILDLKPSDMILFLLDFLISFCHNVDEILKENCPF